MPKMGWKELALLDRVHCEELNIWQKQCRAFMYYVNSLSPLSPLSGADYLLHNPSVRVADIVTFLSLKENKKEKLFWATPMGHPFAKLNLTPTELLSED
jgi:hypothetical protein